MFKPMLPEILITVSFVEHLLLGMLFYENNGSASAALREIRRRRNLLRGPMSVKDIQAMIKISEETVKSELNLEKYLRGCTC
ncbi:hypothetical protein TNCV_3436111 [Trichonephila clavipes]|nr:hypothetical protein TNCV_3436111 [Trichonephila clavipes]